VSALECPMTSACFLPCFPFLWGIRTCSRTRTHTHIVGGVRMANFAGWGVGWVYGVWCGTGGVAASASAKTTPTCLRPRASTAPLAPRQQNLPPNRKPNPLRTGSKTKKITGSKCSCRRASAACSSALPLHASANNRSRSRSSRVRGRAAAALRPSAAGPPRPLPLPWAARRLHAYRPGLRYCQQGISSDVSPHGRHWTGFRIGILDVGPPARPPPVPPLVPRSPPAPPPLRPPRVPATHLFWCLFGDASASCGARAVPARLGVRCRLAPPCALVDLSSPAPKPHASECPPHASSRSDA